MPAVSFFVSLDTGCVPGASRPVPIARLRFDGTAFETLPVEGADKEALGLVNPLGSLQTPPAAALLTDSLPDTWASRVLRMLLAARARRFETRPEPADEALLLASICDDTRLGALRISRGPAPNEFLSVRIHNLPRTEHLAELAATARRIEAGDIIAVSLLEPFAQSALALGGSRPKASFAGEDGRLWIAKFPSREDERDKGAWEACVTNLARAAGIRTSPCLLTDVSEARGRVFCVPRFDRTPEGGRLHYLSLKALLGAHANREAHAYRDVVRLIDAICFDPVREKEELFARTVFKCLVHDGDDHLRNQGFLLTERGWELSPAFDLNASASRTRMTLTYGAGRRELSVPAVLEECTDWDLTPERARAIADSVADAVKNWQDEAARLCISESEIDAMCPAFAFGPF